MNRDYLPLCLAWKRLLENRSVPFNRSFESLLQSGHAHLHNNRVILDNPEALADLLSSHCTPVFRMQEKAQGLMNRLGLDIYVDSRPQECLALLQALQNRNESLGQASQQQVSATVFGNSKYLGKTSLLRRIWQAWLRTQPSRGELRIRAFSGILHHASGLDLSLITRNFGSVLLEPGPAMRPGDFALTGIARVVTCENLAPFRQLSLDQGLLIYSRGYASRSLGDWLAALPKACTWQHFGDLDADGLFIFEDLQAKSGRQGCFIPDPVKIQKLLAAVRPWHGARVMNPEKYAHESVRKVAEASLRLGLEVEQETLLAACAGQDLPLTVLGLEGATLDTDRVSRPNTDPEE